MNQTKKKRLVLSLLPPLAVLCVRFGPLLFGLEWRLSYRGVLNIVTAVVLIPWIIVWFVLTKKDLLCLLVVPAGMLAVGLVLTIAGAQIEGPHEYITELDGVSYVIEIDDGTLSSKQLYPFVNEVFRGAEADFDALQKFWGS